MDKVEQLIRGPFTRAMAREAGVTDRMLQGSRFVRVMPRVWRHRDHAMTDDDWRVAAALALPPSAHLTGISRLQAAGLDYGPRLPVRYVLPGPEVNTSVEVGTDATVVGDLVYRDYGMLVEYEGKQHQEDRAQYRRDLDRYELLRDHSQRYVQITHEHLSTPRVAVGRVYRGLLKAGYDGPPPTFGDQWRLLFLSISAAVGPREFGRVSA